MLVYNAISTGLDCAIVETLGIGKKWKNILEIKSSPFHGLQRPLQPALATFPTSPLTLLPMSRHTGPLALPQIRLGHYYPRAFALAMYIHSIKRVCMEDNCKNEKRCDTWGIN